MVSVFIVSQPDYTDENIDSVWSDERAAKKRAAELAVAFITEYRLDEANGWVRNGWYMKGHRRNLVWSDWR